MTINRTKVLPNFYIEINDVDVTEYIISDGFFSPNTKDKISSGSFQLDKSVIYIITPKKYQVVSFYVELDNKYKKFGGVISDISEDKSKYRYTIDVKSYAWLLFQTDFTGIFRYDTGKGNRKTIITDILTEKFPNITWTNDTFPDIDSSFDILYKLYNNKKPGDIFDELIIPIGRDWWIDKNNVFYCQERIYTKVNRPVIYGTNTNGFPIIDINNNYANIVKVFGKSFEKTIPHTFSGTGGKDEFDLDFYPIGSSDVEYTDGTIISVTMEGNDDYNDGAVYDAYFQQTEKKLKFNVNTSSGTNNIIVKTQSYDQIREEVSSSTEISRINCEVVKEIRNDDIATSEEAYLIGKNYLDNYGTEQFIFLVGVVLSDDDDLSGWVAGNAIPLTLLSTTSSYEDIVQENWSWGQQKPLTLVLRFVDFSRTDNDLLKDLINRVNVKEHQIDKASTNITRFFYMGQNIIFNLQNVSYKTQPTDGRFEMQSNSAIWDNRSLMDRDGTLPGGTIPAAIMMRGDYTTTLSIGVSINSRSKFIESFLDDWFIDDDNTTASVDIENQQVTF